MICIFEGKSKMFTCQWNVKLQEFADEKVRMEGGHPFSLTTTMAVNFLI
ncbi:hypothetical protein M5D96_008143 [Drosophila gunungcola]|uniref:Uncharacterized protein n=1 Tax=Drosophila gunungcola TaxID=103775 RepID=A0A9P9YMZ6_9MUSC|nr:hypothetical protein M5D96_008143 [Drosophila gunungcola]